MPKKREAPIAKKTAKFLKRVVKPAPASVKGSDPLPTRRELEKVTDIAKHSHAELRGMIVPPGDIKEQFCIEITKPTDQHYRKWVRKFLPGAIAGEKFHGTAFEVTAQASKAMLMSESQAIYAMRYMMAPEKFALKLYGSQYAVVHCPEYQKLVAKEEARERRKAETVGSKVCRHCWHMMNRDGMLVKQCCFCGETKDTKYNRLQHGRYVPDVMEVV